MNAAYILWYISMYLMKIFAVPQMETGYKSLTYFSKTVTYLKTCKFFILFLNLIQMNKLFRTMFVRTLPCIFIILLGLFTRKYTWMCCDLWSSSPLICVSGILSSITSWNFQILVQKIARRWKHCKFCSLYISHFKTIWQSCCCSCRPHDILILFC